MDDVQFSRRLLARHGDEARVFLDRDDHLGHGQRAGEAELDHLADVMADRRLVQALEVLREGRNDHVRAALHVLAGPGASLGFGVLRHDVSPSVAATPRRHTMWQAPSMNARLLRSGTPARPWWAVRAVRRAVPARPSPSCGAVAPPRGPR